MYIYVLKLQHGKFYVGKTNNPNPRFREHLDGNGKGSEWTRIHTPVSEIECEEVPRDQDAGILEHSKTLHYMRRHGVDNVRGAEFCSPVLSRQAKESIERTLRGSSDGCFRCGRSSHWVRDCYAQTDVDGNRISNDEDWESDDDDDTDE